MIDLSKVCNYYVVCGYTDLRFGIQGLAAIVTQQYGKAMDEESLFLFCGRRTDRIKALYWSGDGYILLYKRLSNGRFQWDANGSRTAAHGSPELSLAHGGTKGGAENRDLKG